MSSRFAAIAFVALILSTRPALAGASIFGFSIGEDTMTLGAILTQAIQQVAVLKDVAEFSSAVADNIAFVKDVYETGNDVINGDWESLSSEFLGELIASDPQLREIYSNTTDIVENRVRGNGRFRKLLGAGFNTFVVEAFGPAPIGPNAERYGLIDYRSMTLNALADQQTEEWRRKRNAKRIQQAWEDCDGGLERCGHAQGKMTAQIASSLEDLKLLSAERARAEALRMANENADRKTRAAALNRDAQAIIDAARELRAEQQSLIFRDEDFNSEDAR